MLSKNPLYSMTYYLVRKGTPLHKAVSSYQALCVSFVKRTEALIKNYGAYSAVKSFDCGGVIVSGLNFAEGTEPKDWVMDEFGTFSPKGGNKAALAFDFILPPLPVHYPEAARGIKFGFLGDAMIVAVRPDAAGKTPEIEGAKRLDRAAFDKLMNAAPKEDQARIKKLCSYDWAPSPLLETKAFTISDEIEETNIERTMSARKASRAPRGLLARPLPAACNG